MAFLSKPTLTPLLLTYDNESMYLHTDSQGCTLFGEDSYEPFYRIQEPLLLAHGIMTDCKTVHLVVLKTNGELCYTLISGASTPQTTLIAKLDVRSLSYQRLFLFPQGKIIHIFYAHTHQAIRDVWHIEHCYWDGSCWHSVRLGEVVHPREPLYHVNLDSQGNLHLLTITFQGRHSLLYTNRFNGTFHIWGSPAETLKISGEIVDSAALMTSDNVQHLFWVVKAPNGKFEIRSAQQTDAHELASIWNPSPAPIKTFSLPWKSIGAIEINGVLWLLVHTGEEVLMRNDGKGWKLVSSQTPFHHPFRWVHKGKKNFHQTNWLEDQVVRRSPAYHHELGFTIKNQPAPLLESVPPTPTPTTPPPIPAFYPVLSSFPICEESSRPQILCEEVVLPQPLQENTELERLVSIVTHLEEKNVDMSLTLQSVLSKFDQILETMSENALQFKQEVTLPTVEIPFDELTPVKEAISNLENETQSLSHILRVMMVKQDESYSSLERLETQLCQLQTEKEDVKNKGGFWNKWIT